MASISIKPKRAAAAGRLATNLLSMLISLSGLLVFTFNLSHLSPVDPVLQVVGDHASASTYTQVRQQLGLDQPLPVQFWHYIGQLLHGNLGISQSTRQPVLNDLLRTFPATFELATCAILFGTTFGISLALLAVWKKGGDRFPGPYHLIIWLFRTDILARAAGVTAVLCPAALVSGSGTAG